MRTLLGYHAACNGKDSWPLKIGCVVALEECNSLLKVVNNKHSFIKMHLSFLQFMMSVFLICLLLLFGVPLVWYLLIKQHISPPTMPRYQSTWGITSHPSWASDVSNLIVQPSSILLCAHPWTCQSSGAFCCNIVASDPFLLNAF